MPAITSENAFIRFTGRTDPSPSGTWFYWPGTSALICFRGTELRLKCEVKDLWGTNALGCVVDGRNSKMPIHPWMNGRETEFVLAAGLAKNTDHSVLLYKRNDSNYALRVISFETDGVFTSPPPRPALRLEFYGDSVTSGCCVECEDYVGLEDPQGNDSCYDNCYFSYAWQCARLLNAEAHINGQGGIGVMDGTGYFCLPNGGIGMQSCFDKLCYYSEAGPVTPWDFSRFQPHAVIFALGQNDAHNALTLQRDLVCEGAYREKWKNAYKDIARKVASHYPDGTPLIFMTTLIRHEKAWDDAIHELTRELREEGLNARRFLLTRNGDGTNGHPRISEQAEMARELAEELKRVLKL